MPLFLECDRCTACCRWPGQVRLAEGEAEAIAAYLGMPVEAFIQEHTRLTHRRDGLALLDQSNGACAWLEDGGCRINPVKPQQCRDFPNLWNFPGFEQVCQAKPVEVTAEEWRRRVGRGPTMEIPASAMRDPRASQPPQQQQQQQQQ